MACDYNPKQMQCKKIIEGLYSGSKECAQDLQFLVSNKFQFVINCAIDVPNYFESHGLNYLQLRGSDEKWRGLFEGGLKRIEKMSQFILGAEQMGMCCMVHCSKGGRSTVFLIGYFMHRFRWSCDKVMQFLRSKAIKLAANSPYLTELRGVEQQIRESGSPLSSDWSGPYLNDDELIATKTYLNSLKPVPFAGSRPNKLNALHISWKDKLDKQDRTIRKQQDFDTHKSPRRTYDQDLTLKKPEQEKNREVKNNANASEKTLPSDRVITSDRGIVSDRGMLSDRVVKLTIKKPDEKKRTHSPNMIRRENKQELKHVKSLKGLELPPRNGNHLSPTNHNNIRDEKLDTIQSFKQEQRAKEHIRMVSAKKRREQPEQSFEQEKQQRIIQSLNPNVNVLYDVSKRNGESATDFQFYETSKPFIPRPNIPSHNEPYRVSFQDYGRRENFDATQRRDSGTDTYQRREQRIDDRNRIEMQEREVNRSRDRGENRNVSRDKRDYVGYKIPINNYLKPSINVVPPIAPQITYQYARRDSRDNLAQGTSSPRIITMYKDRPSSKQGRRV